MAGCRGPDSKLGKEPQDLGAPPGGGTRLWPRPSLPRPQTPPTVSSEVGKLLQQPRTGGSSPGESAGPSPGRSPFSAAFVVPCVPTRASASLTQSRARIVSPPPTHPQRAGKLQYFSGTANVL